MLNGRSIVRLFNSQFTVCSVPLHATMNTDREFEVVLSLLNSLPSHLNDVHNHPASKLEIHRQRAVCAGVTEAHLSKIPMIHVTGTKGKGSACSYIESILRHHGYRTGFFSSPHLVDVRERIRIDGQSITESEFVNLFYRVYHSLEAVKKHPNDMPFYFSMLTIMGLAHFIECQVDVAILEVGIGGEYDCTNIIPRSIAAVITTLDYDHVNILGSTLETIAWNKAGIMRSGNLGCHCFTVEHQPPAAMAVIRYRSQELMCPLTVVPGDGTKQLSCHHQVQASNVRLAYAVCQHFMANKLDLWTAYTGVANCSWPGRYQMLRTPFANVYLDGAHTSATLRLTFSWFREQCDSSIHRNVKYRRLLFCITGTRNPRSMIAEMAPATAPYFHTVVLACVNSQINAFDLMQQHRNLWLDMQPTINPEDVIALHSVREAINYLSRLEFSNILVTGSLHLVGDTLALLM